MLIFFYKKTKIKKKELNMKNKKNLNFSSKNSFFPAF